MEIQWQSLFGGNGTDTVSSLQKTPDGYILAGSSTSSRSDGNSSMYIVKISENGSQLWNKTFTGGLGSTGNYILPVKNGFLIAGVEWTAKYPSGVATVVRIDDAGNELWRQDLLVNNSTYSEANCILARDGGFIIAGYSYAANVDPAYKYTMFTASMSNDGSISRLTTFPDVFQYRPMAIENGENGYLVAGIRYTPYEFTYSGYITKINNSDEEEWLYQYKLGSYHTLLYSLQKAGADRYISAGGYSDQDKVNGIYMVAINESGGIVQYNTFPNIMNASALAMTLDNDNVVLTGWVISKSGSSDLLLMKTQLNGTVITSKGIQTGSNINGYDVKPDGNGNYVVAGNFAKLSGPVASNNTTTGIFVAKISLANNATVNNTTTGTHANGNTCLPLIVLPLLSVFVIIAKKLKK